jgi:hypothetical protein
VSATHSTHWSYSAHGDPAVGVGEGVGATGASVGAGVGGAGVGQVPLGPTLIALLHAAPSMQLVPQKRQFGDSGCRATSTHCEHAPL